MFGSCCTLPPLGLSFVPQNSHSCTPNRPPALFSRPSRRTAATGASFQIPTSQAKQSRRIPFGEPSVAHASHVSLVSFFVCVFFISGVSKFTPVICQKDHELECVDVTANRLRLRAPPAGKARLECESRRLPAAASPFLRTPLVENGPWKLRNLASFLRLFGNLTVDLAFLDYASQRFGIAGHVEVSRATASCQVAET